MKRRPFDRGAGVGRVASGLSNQIKSSFFQIKSNQVTARHVGVGRVASGRGRDPPGRASPFTSNHLSFHIKSNQIYFKSNQIK